MSMLQNEITKCSENNLAHCFGFVVERPNTEPHSLLELNHETNMIQPSLTLNAELIAVTVSLSDWTVWAFGASLELGSVAPALR